MVCTVPLEASSAKLFPETELKVFCGCFFFSPLYIEFIIYRHIFDN